ncbi:hypothetical protein WR25_11200 [Diploscapter pachys]|uniref:Uncharacterized protein n=1 Tax=Diploscapter pachys TaxID=2018661 RepID=A0A2A2LTZ8_9BILA|nr:hypothetical protein WR25_11200 [Diploscapter pachys]
MNMDDNVPVHSRAQFVAISADDSSLCPVHCEGTDPFPANFDVLSQGALRLRNTFDVHPGSRIVFEDPQEQVLLGQFGGLTIFAKVLPSPEQTSSVISFQELNDACRVLVKLVSVLDTLFVTLLVVLFHVLHSEETATWELLF